MLERISKIAGRSARHGSGHDNTAEARNRPVSASATRRNSAPRRERSRGALLAAAVALPRGDERCTLPVACQWMMRSERRRQSDGRRILTTTKSVDLNVEGATPVAMRGVSLARAIQVVVDQWPSSREASVLINRDGPDIRSHDEVLEIYKRDDFPRSPKPNKAP